METKLIGKKLKDDQITVAVEWWCRDLINPSFKNVTDKEIEKNPRDGFAQFMRNQLPLSDVSESQIMKFKEKLTEILKQHDDNRIFLEVDYGPNKTLSEAAEYSGVDNDRFSWKTSMHLADDGTVSVSKGYGAEWETILS